MGEPGLIRRPVLRRWSRLLMSHAVVESSLGISVFFFANIGITALLVDPLFRYDFSLLMLKIMLSGIGASIVFRIVEHFEAPISFR
jgi:hypothetical protein